MAVGWIRQMALFPSGELAMDDRVSEMATSSMPGSPIQMKPQLLAALLATSYLGRWPASGLRGRACRFLDQVSSIWRFLWFRQSSGKAQCTPHQAVDLSLRGKAATKESQKTSEDALSNWHCCTAVRNLHSSFRR